VALTAILVLAMVLLPAAVPAELGSRRGKATPADRASAVNSIRSTLMQGLAGLAVLAGVLFTWRQLQVSRQGQVTDRYTRAIDQLGQAGAEVRVGGIYALERIARDSLADRLTIVEVLTAFIRLHSPLSPGTDERQRPPDPAAKFAAAQTMEKRLPMRDRAPDIQAAITVLGRMPGAGQKRSCELSRTDLTRSDLDQGDLAGADLHYSDLSQSHLVGADFRRADLTGTWFVRALLIRARLHQADLRSAVLWQARLDRADLRATDLTSADLTGARLDGARLDLADLRGADLSQADLADATFRGAVADDTTIWPAGFDPQHAGVLPADAALPFRPQSYFDEA
jgi:Pentapeptide repeats (8 copies)